MTDRAEDRERLSAPIDMVLHCPACGAQHIDAPESPGEYTLRGYDPLGAVALAWTNPPHRSHLCHGCGHIWRPADVPTNGVAAVKTRGKNDPPAVSLAAPAVSLAAEVERLKAENDKLRAKLGNSPEPCAYCGIPADRLLECRHGFPGCPRADDMVLCGHFGAAWEAAQMREALAAERRKVEALREALRMLHAVVSTCDLEAENGGPTEEQYTAAMDAAEAALAATEGGE